MRLTKEELLARAERFRRAMDAAFPGWDTVIIVGKVNQYYFTGTMQDALLLIRRGGGISYYVRRSFERALDESPLDCVFEMQSYRDAAQREGRDLGRTYIEAETMTCAILDRLKKYFSMTEIGSADDVLMRLRSVKTPYELFWMKLACARHDELLKKEVPQLLREGISEADFIGALECKMMEYGYQGITRFYRFQTELTAGQIGFGVSSLYPTSFDGPGGARGVCAASPVAGRQDVRLKTGDLVFVDNGFAMNGYHSDKTQVYSFGRKPSGEILRAHRGCIDIQKRLAEKLVPGAIPSAIYDEIIDGLDGFMRPDFMGFGKRSAKFLGHGVGMVVDEMPVIAHNFHEPLEENMTIALEPKKGMAGAGMVGVEDTYLVTPLGGLCLTGGGSDIVVV